ncbi:hypothetical protein EIN43_06990 [Enterobacter hormaechei]|uniref:Uncharacterized protein n=1 Tax=Enterobacter hormaechei TaxID=158836 RepID=A0A4Y5ZNN5_9ENTR|nr:hypothetical protein EIN43_06990 [Enterobacter hormaechei]
MWRKLYQKQALSASIQARDEEEAAKRSALMEIRFMQLAQLAVPFVAIRETLKQYRNELVMQSKIAFLASVAGNPASVSDRSAFCRPHQKPTSDVCTTGNPITLALLRKWL